MKFCNNTTSIEISQNLNLIVNNKEYYNSTIYRTLNNTTKHPTTLKILLGHKCNLSCSYCLQISKVKSELYDFTRWPDMSKVNRIELWGGEPLLYWEVIKKIHKLYDKENLTWLIVTNGILLSKKHIEFMEKSKGDWKLTISHEGPFQIKLRGKDPLILPSVIEALSACRKTKIMFNATISEINRNPLRVIKYLEHYGYLINFEIITGYNTQTSSLVVRSYHKYKNNLINAINYNSKVPTNLKDFGTGIYPIIDRFKKKIIGEENIWSCGTDHSHQMTINLKGDQLVCQNSDEKYHIIERNEKCQNCPVLTLCKGGCPLSFSELNCNIRYVHYLTLLELAISDIFKPIFKDDFYFHLVTEAEL